MSQVVARVTFCLVVLVRIGLGDAWADETNAQEDAQGIAFFEAKIRPVLVEHCYNCHSVGADKSEGGLVLDSRKGIRAGGDRGPSVVPGDPKASLLLTAISHSDPDLKMPPKKERLPDSVIHDIQTWIRLGAADPRQDGPNKNSRAPVDIESGRQFWSFQKPVAHPTPATKDPSWAKRELDHFILAKLDTGGLRPSPDAEPATLLRRLHFDLVGLPPSLAAVRRFLERVASDGLDVALEAEVDPLLASQHFGERWGRHWLDVARFAESSGKEANISFPYAWRYRDYVFDAMNADIPFDRFLVEQIAGDQLPYDGDAERARLLIATGFLALGPKNLDEASPIQFAADVVDEQIDAVTRAVMANSVACARCHDHKFDPYSMADCGTKLLGSPFQFSQHGDSGMWISKVFPLLAKQADELCVIRSMHTDLPNHSQAFTQMHTGSFQFVRPSVGAWTLYGLGSENANLPGFITVNPPSDNGGARNYGSGFLPAICQGTKIGGNQIPGFYAALLGKTEEPGPPLRNIANATLPRGLQRAQLDLVRELNRHKLERDTYHPEIEGAIESFELAFRMQDVVPEVLDMKSEPESILNLYGVGAGLPTDRFGRQCILARRLAEAGVRFIEITAPVGWDHHFMLKEELTKSCAATDQPIAGLLADLKQRGMLQDTLVIWAGEFGRTPYGQSGHGRDHNNKGYTLWMAGGGVQRGLSYGATDEFGYQAVEKPVHIHDWHATVLHLLGLDHERLTFNYGGRNFRLTDVNGDVVTDILT